MEGFQKGLVSIRMVSQSGQVVYTQEIPVTREETTVSIRIPVSLGNGVYDIWVIQDGRKKNVQKLVVNN